MKATVIYCSQTGFTKTYAGWLAEDLGCEAVPFAERGGVALNKTGLLVFCSWFHAASIKGASWLKRAMRRHPGLHVIVLVTGATPMPCEAWPESEIEGAFCRTFPKSDYPYLPHFYCQGGFDYERLGTVDKIAMRLFFKVNTRAAANNPKAAEMLRVMGKGFDGTRRAYLEPVLNYIRRLEGGSELC